MAELAPGAEEAPAAPALTYQDAANGVIRQNTQRLVTQMQLARQAVPSASITGPAPAAAPYSGVLEPGAHPAQPAAPATGPSSLPAPEPAPTPGGPGAGAIGHVTPIPSGTEPAGRGEIAEAGGMPSGGAVGLDAHGVPVYSGAERNGLGVLANGNSFLDWAGVDTSGLPGPIRAITGVAAAPLTWTLAPIGAEEGLAGLGASFAKQTAAGVAGEAASAGANRVLPENLPGAVRTPLVWGAGLAAGLGAYKVADPLVNSAMHLYGEGAPQAARRADIVLGVPDGMNGADHPGVAQLAHDNGAMIIDGAQTGLEQPHAAVAEGLQFAQAVHQGDNVVIPLPGNEPEATQQLIATLKEAGYDTHVHATADYGGVQAGGAGPGGALRGGAPAEAGAAGEPAAAGAGPAGGAASAADGAAAAPGEHPVGGTVLAGRVVPPNPLDAVPENWKLHALGADLKPAAPGPLSYAADQLAALRNAEPGLTLTQRVRQTIARIRNALPGADASRGLPFHEQVTPIINQIPETEARFAAQANRLRYLGQAAAEALGADREGMVPLLDGTRADVSDIAQHLSAFRDNLTPEQVATVQRVMDAAAPYAQLANEMGREVPAAAGEGYIPRGRPVEDGTEDIAPRGGRGFRGSKAGSERGRVYETVAEGRANGETYPSLPDRLYEMASSMGRALAAQHAANQLQALLDEDGAKAFLTPKEALAQSNPGLVQAWDGVTRDLAALRGRLATAEGRAGVNVGTADELDRALEAMQQAQPEGGAGSLGRLPSALQDIADRARRLAAAPDAEQVWTSQFANSNDLPTPDELDALLEQKRGQLKTGTDGRVTATKANAQLEHDIGQALALRDMAQSLERNGGDVAAMYDDLQSRWEQAGRALELRGTPDMRARMLKYESAARDYQQATAGLPADLTLPSLRAYENSLAEIVGTGSMVPGDVLRGQAEGMQAAVGELERLVPDDAERIRYLDTAIARTEQRVDQLLTRGGNYTTQAEELRSQLADVKQRYDELAPRYRQAITSRPRGMGSVSNLVGMQGKWAPLEMTNPINEALAPKGHPLGVLGSINKALIVPRVAFDVAYAGRLAFLRNLYTDTSATVKAFADSWAQVAKPEVIGNLYDSLDRGAIEAGHPELTVQNMVADGLELAGHERTSSAGGLLGRVAETAKGVRSTLSAYQAAAAPMMAQSRLLDMAAAGIDISNPAVRQEVYTFANRAVGQATGGINPLLRATTMFPNWLQSEIQFVGSAFTSGQISGAYARESLLRTAAEGLAVTVALNHLQGKPTTFRDHIIPMLHVPGTDLTVNPYGTTGTFVGELARTVEGNPAQLEQGVHDRNAGEIMTGALAAIKGDPSVLIRSKSNPLIQMGWDIVSGRDLSGNPVRSSPGAVAAYAFHDLGPMNLSGLGEREPAAQGLGSLGIPVYQPTPGQKLREDATSKFQAQIGPGGVEPYMLDQERRQNPALAAAALGRSYPNTQKWDAAKQTARTRQLAYDAQVMKDGNWTAWKDQRTALQHELSGEFEQIYGNQAGPTVNPQAPWQVYGQVIQQHTDPTTGAVDWNAVDAWRQQHDSDPYGTTGQTWGEVIDRNIGLADTPLEARRRAVSTALTQQGYYQLDRNAWAAVQQHAPAGLALDQFPDYQHWLTAAIEHFASGYEQQGIPTGIAQQQAVQDAAKTTVGKAWANALAYQRTAWLDQQANAGHVGLIASGADYGLVSLNGHQRVILANLLRSQPNGASIGGLQLPPPPAATPTPTPVPAGVAS